MTEFDLRSLLDALNNHGVEFVVIGGVAESELLGIPVRVCSLARLREMKMAQGRAQDRLDLENLPES